MRQYIDKAAVMAEINRRIAFFSDINNKQVVDSNLDCAIAFAGLRDFLDTLEAKEVNLDEEIERFVKSEEFQKASGTIKMTNLLAKHFFELGLAQQNDKQNE